MDNDHTAPEATVLPGIIFGAVLGLLGLIFFPTFVAGLAGYAYTCLTYTIAPVFQALVDSIAALASLVGLG